MLAPRLFLGLLGVWPATSRGVTKGHQAAAAGSGSTGRRQQRRRVYPGLHAARTSSAGFDTQLSSPERNSPCGARPQLLPGPLPKWGRRAAQSLSSLR